eukprot:GHVN01065301.1.p1 GENE.GHVN01065301.1~~GHVN01065301.1.p1  ORF type:complete len:245 (-),score=67.51 GHVN01065301.1:191-925(-)
MRGTDAEALPPFAPWLVVERAQFSQDGWTCVVVVRTVTLSPHSTPSSICPSIPSSPHSTPHSPHSRVGRRGYAVIGPGRRSGVENAASSRYPHAVPVSQSEGFSGLLFYRLHPGPVECVMKVKCEQVGLIALYFNSNIFAFTGAPDPNTNHSVEMSRVTPSSRTLDYFPSLPAGEDMRQTHYGSVWSPTNANQESDSLSTPVEPTELVMCYVHPLGYSPRSHHLPQSPQSAQSPDSPQSPDSLH